MAHLKEFTELAARFAADGYVAPLAACAADEAGRALARVTPLLDARGRADARLRNNPHLLFTWADALIDLPPVLAAVGALIGPDLLVRDTVLFAKGPHDPTAVDWHQDGGNWDVEGEQVVTAWIALTDSGADNAAVRVVPGSHRGPRRPHRLGRDAAGRLIRSRVEGAVDERQAVALTLRGGECSLHGPWLLHGSPANPGPAPRIGLAVRYVSPDLRERFPGAAATLVAGRAPGRGWALRPRPRHDHDPRAAAWHRRALRRYAVHVTWQLLRAPSADHLRLLAHLVRREVSRAPSGRAVA